MLVSFSHFIAVIAISANKSANTSDKQTRRDRDGVDHTIPPEEGSQLLTTRRVAWADPAVVALGLENIPSRRASPGAEKVYKGGVQDLKSRTTFSMLTKVSHHQESESQGTRPRLGHWHGLQVFNFDLALAGCFCLFCLLPQVNIRGTVKKLSNFRGFVTLSTSLSCPSCLVCIPRFYVCFPFISQVHLSHSPSHLRSKTQLDLDRVLSRSSDFPHSCLPSQLTPPPPLLSHRCYQARNKCRNSAPSKESADRVLTCQ
ncbi:hypothetical protein B0H67DRAFT_137924 [Lasiosphaeris hirsuta]|uniref:Uncharacterized protein n=1 Tax=Lasiosphaeris hirsuta TaxID=260670 RepID=A0AA40B117_9PEZI|nr:hypothetical protein B0H67DRAFT_137924 [Lasiosphaeris hirsuta]